MRRVIRLFGLALALLLAPPARATVSTTTSTVSYTCNASTTVFPVSFPFFTTGDLVVTNTPAGAAPITLHAGIDVTVTGGNGSTGTLTTSGGYSPCANGNTLTISRNMLLTQPTHFSTQGAFSPKAHEKAFDRLTMGVQQVDQRVAGAEATHAADKVAQQTRDIAQDAATAAVKIDTLAAAASAVGAINNQSHTPNDVASVLAFGSATARTLTNRFADVVNVIDFLPSGQPDGSTNNIAGILLAMNRAVARGGGTVLFPKTSGSCYMVSYAIPAMSNVRLLGEDQSVCIKAMNGTVDNVIGVGGRMLYAMRAALDAGYAGWKHTELITAPGWSTTLTPEQAYTANGWAGYAVYNFGVENLTIDGNRANRPVSATVEYVGPAANPYDSEVFFKPLEAVTGSISGASGKVIYFNDQGSGTYGFRVDPATWNGIAFQTGDVVTGAESGANITIASTVQDDSIGTGITFETVLRGYVRRCVVKNTPLAGIVLYNQSLFNDVADNLLVNNNDEASVAYTHNNIIQDYGSSFNTIHGNTLIQHQSGYAITIQDPGGSTRNTKVVGNRILNAFTQGIFFSKAGNTFDGLEIKDNYVEGASCAATGSSPCDNGNAGIDLRNQGAGVLSGVSVTGNVVKAMQYGIIAGKAASGSTITGNTVLACGAGGGFLVDTPNDHTNLSGNTVKGSCGNYDYYVYAGTGNSIGPNVSDGAPAMTLPGALSAASVTSTGAVTTGSVSSTGQVAAGSVSATNAVTGKYSASTGQASFTAPNQMLADFTGGGGRTVVSGPSAGNRTGWSLVLTDSAGANAVTPLVTDGAGVITMEPTNGVLKIPKIKATTGTRYICIGTDGALVSSASACSGT